MFLRHGKTKGNLEKRYVGRTEESILPEECERIQNMKTTIDTLLDTVQMDALFTSPMIRCVETAQILYPMRNLEMIDDFRECDFGDFEYRNYQELKDNLQYQQWIDSNGTWPFPNGEDMESFKKRCQNAFQKSVDQAMKKGKTQIGYVVHGGTIMAILDGYAIPHKEYFQWQVGNLNGYVGDIILKDEQWWITNLQKLQD